MNENTVTKVRHLNDLNSFNKEFPLRKMVAVESIPADSQKIAQIVIPHNEVYVVEIIRFMSDGDFEIKIAEGDKTAKFYGDVAVKRDSFLRDTGIYEDKPDRLVRVLNPGSTVDFTVTDLSGGSNNVYITLIGERWKQSE